MNLHDKCPFCGAGEEGRNSIWVTFDCHTTMHTDGESRRFQAPECKDAERTRLAARVAELEARCKRLDELGSKLEEEKEAHAWEISPAMAQAKIDELNARVAALEARCKRLEEAGDAMAEWNMNERNLGCDPELAHKWQQAKEAKP